MIVDDDAIPAVDALHAAGTPGDVLGMRSARSQERLAATALGQTILDEGIEVYARSSG